MKVIFSVMRHGEKDGDSLTPLGEQQVRRSARAHLGDTNPTLAFCSGMDRARQTASHALAEIDSKIPVQDEPGFGYMWADTPLFPYPPRMAIADAARKTGQPLTVAEWLHIQPTAREIRGRFMGTLEKWAIALGIQLPGKDVIHVIVGSHSPTSELATPTPDVTPLLGLADIARYVVDVDADSLRTTIESCEVLACPAE